MALQKGRSNSGVKNLIKLKKGERLWKDIPRSIICANCAKEFISTAPNSRYCSSNCYKKSSLIIKRKSFIFCEVCGEKSIYKKCGGVEKGFCSQLCSGIERTIFRSKSNYYYKALFAHGIKCDLCGNENYKHLVVHHKNRNRKDNSLENLQVLCANCHHEIHFGNAKIRTKRIENYLAIVRRNKDAFEAWVQQKND